MERQGGALEPNLRSASSSLYLAAPLPWWLAFLLLGLCLTLRLRGRFTKEQGYYGVADMERQGGVRDVCYTTTTSSGEKEQQQDQQTAWEASSATSSASPRVSRRTAALDA